MKTATKLFIKALIWEFLAGILTIFVYYVIIEKLFSSYSIRDVIIFLSCLILSYIVSVIPLIPIIYYLGEKVDWAKFSIKNRLRYGILLQFLFLIIASLFIPSILFIFELFISGKFEINVLGKILIFSLSLLIFGGIQTLCVGIWLGKKLSKIEA